MLHRSDPNWLTDEQYLAASPAEKKAAEAYQAEAGRDPFAGCKSKKAKEPENKK